LLEPLSIHSAVPCQESPDFALMCQHMSQVQVKRCYCKASSFILFAVIRGLRSIMTVIAAYSVLATSLAAILAATPLGAAELTYDIYLGPLSVGTAKLSVESEGGSYSAKLKGDYGFLTNSGTVSVASKGILKSGKAVAGAFSSTVKGKETTVTKIAYAGGTATEVTRTPAPKKSNLKNRIPVTDEQKAGIPDPLGALLAQASRAAKGDPCTGTLSVFTGQDRLDLALSNGGERNGDILCNVKYIPISGHKKGDKGVERLRSADIKVAFPSASEGSLRFPSYVSVPIRFGKLIIEQRR
jgi:hypothetical protein